MRLQTMLMLGLDHSAELCFLQPPAATDDDNIFFRQRFCCLIYNDDDRALHDLSTDSTMTPPLLCDTAYLSVT